MADQLLSQADVDALVASLTRNEPPKPATPPAQVAPKPAAPIIPVQAKPTPVSLTAKPISPVATKTATPVPAGIKPTASPMAVPSKPAPMRQEAKAEVNPELINNLNNKVSELTKQINQMGAALKRIDNLEKKIKELEASSKSKNGAVTEQKVQQLSDELKKMAVNLKGTPGYGIKNSFNCEKCSDHGHVAVMFRCTQCGHERWYGWWPEK